jgi:hypothetical protein
MPGGEKPEGKGEKPEPPSGDPNGERPENPFASDDPGRNNPGRGPESKRPGDPSRAEGDERWGDLPPRAREVFRTKGGADMPSQYRDWIEAYYRRLNRTRDGL